MKTIEPTIIETEVYPVAVDFTSSLDNADEDYLIIGYDLINEMVSYHYDVCEEPYNYDDVFSEDAAEYLQEVLTEKTDTNCTKALALELMDRMADKIISKIKENDDEAIEEYNEYNAYCMRGL